MEMKTFSDQQKHDDDMYREGDSEIDINTQFFHDLYPATNSLDARRMIQLIGGITRGPI